jgi:putative nucleotidyltransferase with HDIG domain
MRNSKATSEQPRLLDRVAFAAYFLGAVFPLAALAVIVDRFVLPELQSSLAATGLIGLVVSLAVLSLGSFFTLRQSTRASLAHMDEDNHRLESLLHVSGTLADAEYGHEAAATAAKCALELTSARAAFVLVRSDSDSHPVLLESAGHEPSEVFASAGKTLTELSSMVIDEGRPALRGPDVDGNEPIGDSKGFTSAAVVPIPGDSGTLGALIVVHSKQGLEFEPAQVNALSTLGALVSVSLRNAELRDTQRNFFSHITEILVLALDTHRNSHKGHGHRVAQHANRLGRDLGLDDEALQRLHFAAMLHDIGILKLDPNAKMNSKSGEKHTIIGARMLGGIRLWEHLAPIVHSHHERFDGDGYPDGLAGDDIPIESRIIAICDAFDSMTGNTSYKIAMTTEDALVEIDDCAGTQFDPDLSHRIHKLVRDGIITA